MSEKLCLKWNDFQENINSAFGSLRQDNAFTDVTLACVDGKQLEAHKVILAASSPFFQNLLGKSKHAHPIVYLKGMKSEELVAMLDFLYYGEANVYQENLDSFLAIAEEFQLKGLTGKLDEEEVKEENQRAYIRPIQKPYKPKETDFNGALPSKERACDIWNQSDNVVAIPKHLSGDLKELDEKVSSMMKKSENLLPNGQRKAHICTVCGKEGHGNDIKKHIESNHLEGVSIPCNLCEKTFRSRRSHQSHMMQYHR